MNDVTLILSAIEQGDSHAAEQLLPIVYEELRKLAARRLADERPGQTLQATALVHDAYLRLVDVERPQQWDGRGHFFAAAAEAMRRILVERARARNAIKRGGKFHRVALDDAAPLAAPRENLEEILELDAALERLAQEDAGIAELVKLIYFAGLSVTEAATVQGISRTTAHRRWIYARAWLRDAIHGNEKKSV